MDNEKENLLEEESYEPEIIELDDDNGDKHKFEVIDSTKIGDDLYFMLSPWEDENEESEDEADIEEDDGSFLIMRLFEDENDEYLEIVEDPDELQSAVQVFTSRLEDFFNIELD